MYSLRYDPDYCEDIMREQKERESKEKGLANTNKGDK